MLASPSAIIADTPPCSTLNGCHAQQRSKVSLQSSQVVQARAFRDGFTDLAARGRDDEVAGEPRRRDLVDLEAEGMERRVQFRRLGGRRRGVHGSARGRRLVGALGLGKMRVTCVRVERAVEGLVGLWSLWTDDRDCHD